jgi:geranylgeranyl diphosphate synthase type II
MFTKEYEECRAAVDGRLESFFAGGYSRELTESVRYSLFSGGKRIRPVLTMQFCRAAGGDMEKALPLACAVEMIHTYSLIHDDLPCMDDDDFRRGSPTNHKVFGEAVAVLAGDALQAEAFAAVFSADLPEKAVVAAGKTLAGAAGYLGICGGQALDMLAGGAPDSSQIEKIYELKTAALLIAAAKLGVIAAGGDKAQTDAAARYALDIGVAFQICDDLIELQDEGGAASDEKNDKKTLAALIGPDESLKIAEERTKSAISAVSNAFNDMEFLAWFANYLVQRKY